MVTKTKTILTILMPLLLFTVACSNSPSANLVFNGSAELVRHDTVPEGWNNIQGHWVSLRGDSANHSYGYAQSGSYYFFAGNDTEGILQQDVNVSQYAKNIDNKRQQFFFSSYVQSLDQGANSDQSQIIVTALDNSKDKALFTFNSDTIRSISKWKLVGDTFMAPVSTRFIRIQLMSTRHVGGDNDGYLDNIALTTKTTGLSLLQWILAACFLVGIICITFLEDQQEPKQSKHNGNNLKGRPAELEKAYNLIN